VNRSITDPERVAPGATNATPANQATNQDQVWPHARSLDDLTFEVGGVRLDLSDYIARSRTAGLLILKGGEIALERYGMGSGPKPSDELLDREVDHRDARRRRAPRWHDQQPGRSLRPLPTAAARLGL
jgi:hypothetical protein